MLLSINATSNGMWMVRVGPYQVLFHTEYEGERYLHSLRERIAAPHVLPPSAKTASACKKRQAPST